jgi:hypothetical protein
MYRTRTLSIFPPSLTERSPVATSPHKSVSAGREARKLIACLDLRMRPCQILGSLYPLADYEGHMSSAGVPQLTVLAELFKSALDRCRPESVALQGVAGLQRFRPNRLQRHKEDRCGGYQLAVSR